MRFRTLCPSFRVRVMKDSNETASRSVGEAGQDALAFQARIAELEAEVATLRRALAQAGLSAEQAAETHADELAREQTDNATGRRLAKSAAAAVEAQHDRQMAAGRANIAATEADNEALRRANAALTESRAALRERDERMRLILDSATEYAIFTTDLSRRVTSWNAGAERLLGWTETEIIGRSADPIFTPEDRAAGVPEREAATALAEGRAENERWHLRRNGARFWASGLSMPLRDPAAGPHAPPLGLLAVMRDQTERRWAEARRTLLTDEMNHRVKNTLAVVQSLTSLGTRGASPDLSAFAVAFQRRILALARAHDLLTREDWTGAPLDGVVRAVLAPLLADSDRLDLSTSEGAKVFLPPGAALTLAMAVHELATNAVRHGALSGPSGRVRVVLRAANDDGDAEPWQAVEWVERGGPPIAGPPARRGFGLRLLERGLAIQAGMKADIRFEPDGLHCILRLPPHRRVALGRRTSNA
ncbi:sensor histidine kinase [Belnapia sp. F-4-1]|uniref:sensor histidine kinase n=1 Tax=Belnapia sp. F-4-1 TaxID=1545443 RepID=UPI001184F7DB|nr:HWE histidine kinase domain-containing protein [Belnapia sp. F-4-1]